MKAIWLTESIVKHYASGPEPEQRLLDCPIASARLRTAVGALEWRRAGNENVFCDPFADRADWQAAEICVVTKMFYDVPADQWREACAVAKGHGCRLVLDICDYPFRKPPPVPALYAEVLKDCDAVTVNSQRMAEMIAPHALRPPRVIEDAILGATGVPAFAPGYRLALLWFGHPTNLPYLNDRLAALAQFAGHTRCTLTIVTQRQVEIENWVSRIKSGLAPAIKVHFVEWTLEAARAALGDCDIVLIPSDPSDDLKAGASANRIAEALHAGRFPVASPLPSYLAFEKAAWLGHDIVEGVSWALAHPDESLQRIHHGQRLVTEKFAPEKIGAQWVQLFENLVSEGRNE